MFFLYDEDENVVIKMTCDETAIQSRAAFYKDSIYFYAALTMEDTSDVIARNDYLQGENRRLMTLLSKLGFCYKDGSSLPCLKCGAGL